MNSGEKRAYVPMAGTGSLADGSASDCAVFVIQKMDCPTEEALIRRLRSIAGIEAMQFNLVQRELTIRHRLPSIDPIIATLKSLGMDPAVKADTLRGGPPRTDGDGPRARSGAVSDSWRRWVPMAFAGLAAVSSEIAAWLTGRETSALVMALALAAILSGGLHTLKKGWIALCHLTLNMNFLMSLAVIGAASIGQWPEAAAVIVLFGIAEEIERQSLDRARHAVRELLAITPETATVKTERGDWRDVAAKDVAVGAVVRINPGARIPLDGTVLEGRTTVNQAPITGESMPVLKEPGDPVFAGTINERGALDYRVTATQSRSLLSRIIDTVQAAQARRAPTQRFVDQFARWYTPAVVATAVLAAAIPPLFQGAAFVPSLYKGLVLLVIACPCALVISTPVTVVSGLAAAARHGILIKGGVYLEQGRMLNVLALDKTGTLTAGMPKITDTLVVADGDAATLLGLAASLAHRSDHPVSAAVVAHWTAVPAAGRLADVTDVEALAGRGVKGKIAGVEYYLGNHRLVEELGVCSPALEVTLATYEREGKTVVVFCSASAPLLVLAVADTIRETSVEAIAQIRQLGVKPIMLTGDNRHTAEAVAARVGIDDTRGDLLPEDKLSAIDALIAAHAHVGMVGDGINDAPALARASIGFAMGAAGTDTALETADVALMDDDLRKIPDFLRLSGTTHAVLIQNITLALGVKAVFFALALGGHATLWMAVFADMGTSLLVVFNGMRLLRAYNGRSASVPATRSRP